MHRPLIRVATIALAAVTLCCSMTSPATAGGRRNVGDLIDFIKGKKKKEYTYDVTVTYTTFYGKKDHDAHSKDNEYRMVVRALIAGKTPWQEQSWNKDGREEVDHAVNRRFQATGLKPTGKKRTGKKLRVNLMSDGYEQDELSKDERMGILSQAVTINVDEFKKDVNSITKSTSLSNQVYRFDVRIEVKRIEVKRRKK